MHHIVNRTVMFGGVVAALVAGSARAADWPMWGGGPGRNMVSSETNLPDSFDPGKYKGSSEEIDISTTKNVKWVAKLGSQAYGNPVVAGGKVFVGTNNETPRNPREKTPDGHAIDRGILMCFDEKTGKFLWQLVVPKLGTGKVSDWEYLGICSSPAVEGDRVYLCTNRNEVLCLDVNGLANGNDGPFKEEAQYIAGPGKTPVTLDPTDADIIWRFDMREELGVFPHNITTGSPAIIGDYIVVTTSNGVDWGHTTIPNPRAPAMCVLDKKTGKLLMEEASGVSSRTLHSNWSSAAAGNGQIIFGAGDGWCYGYGMEPAKAADGTAICKELWKFDCNLAQYRMKDGKPVKYATHDGPSEVIATPVVFNNRVYAPIGQDPEHGEGVGNLSCIDITKSGDVTTSGRVWNYDKISRSLSTPSVSNGLLFVGDFSGFIHCLDADTGKPYWVYDTKSHIWGSTMVADGKVYVGTEDGDFLVLAAAKTMKLINKIDMRAPVYATPVIANGTIYIATPTHLYAVGKG